ncbi:hypothetical protein HanPSC8_Chr17g0794071 [Helianthus annuus]|nr:hypothetical protein HanPSC8_Chr17g0794071 [Helianthus annuus]
MVLVKVHQVSLFCILKGRQLIYLGAFFFHLFKIPPYPLRDSRLCDTDTNNFNAWCITCTISLKGIFHCFINLKFYILRFINANVCNNHNAKKGKPIKLTL